MAPRGGATQNGKSDCRCCRENGRGWRSGYSFLRCQQKKKIIVCDEAWLFLKYKESADFLVNVARRGRKYNVPLFIGSQFIDEFLNCEERKDYY